MIIEWVERHHQIPTDPTNNRRRSLCPGTRYHRRSRRRFSHKEHKACCDPSLRSAAIWRATCGLCETSLTSEGEHLHERFSR